MAAGDAMGMPTSMMSPEKIQQMFGSYVTDFLPAPAGHVIHDKMVAGQVTDDTQQTLLIADSIIEKGVIDPEDIARRLIEWGEEVDAFGSMAVGPSSLRALYAIRSGKSVYESGSVGDTNGAVMRIGAVGIYGRGELERTVDAVEKACLPTHNTNIAISGASAVAMAIGCGINGESDVDTIIMKALEAAELGMSRGNIWYGASIIERTKLALQIVSKDADREDIMKELYDIIGAGVQVSETVPTCLAITKLTNGDVVEGIQTAVNLGGDCDTIAAITGSICGAISGVDRIPEAWIEILEKVNPYDFDEYTEKLFRAIYK
ncbi:MAG: ADP-ribosylglycohydrolase family protein [Candidatus Neomarinimicrobiota bacterium]|nr:MAG: ADP-ribosylglycohydrolase family protein [Candidatus Neomarinimicrobiota bacterium]